jgi:Zn-dependent protease
LIERLGISITLAALVVLAVFNALPIPPLAGSRVADTLMPDALRPAWDGLCSVGPVLLIGVLMLPVVFGVSLIDWPLAMTETLLEKMVWLLTR